MKTKLNSITIVAGIVGLMISSNATTKAINTQSQPQSHLSTSDTKINTIIAQGYGSGADDDMRGKGRIWSQLNLSTEQQEQMRGIRQKYQPQMTSLRQQIETEREKLQTMMEAEESDSLLRNQHQKIVEIDQQIHNLRFESMLEMRSVLSAEQKQQFQEMMNERRASRQRRFR